jgi:hypothetical protein
VNPRIGFPLVVALTVSPPSASVSEGSLTAIKDVFEKLRERSRFGVLIIHSESAGCAEQVAQAAKEAGANYRATEGASGTQTVVSAKEGLTPADMELVETSAVLILISSTTADRDNGKKDALLTYAHGMGRPTICIDAETGTLHGEIPEQLETDQSWLPGLFELARLRTDADLETIKSKMSALANKSAPLTRAKWNLIVLLQGLAVCVPLGWLLGVPVQFVSIAAFATTLLLFILHYVLRWRSMQKTWARARLVAETVRSLIAVSAYPASSPWQTLAAVPSLRPLRWARRQAVTQQPLHQWVEHYVTDRIAPQEKYFADARKDAEVQRKKLTAWTSLLLDVAVAFALVGLILVFTPSGYAFVVGGGISQSVLGSVSIVLLLGLLLIQLLRELHELNRRTARFAQQEVVLEQARQRLGHVQSPGPAQAIVTETEARLLGEVLEWYFHAETAERFVEAKETRARSLPARFFREEGAATRMVHALPGVAGDAGLFVLKVILTRLPLILISAATVVVWVLYRLPEHGSDYGSLEKSVHLMDWDDRVPCDPKPADAKWGIVVMVHGLYGRGFLAGNKEDVRNWMEPFALSIRKRLEEHSPAICLVNWSEPALPWQFFNLGFGQRNLIGDLAAIRPQAYVVGDVVAFQLASVMIKNKLNSPIPIHLIGHSAGGFVVTRIAKRLTELGIVSNDPSMLHVTILDTPEPDEELYEELPKLWPTDFYLTSFNVQPLPFRKVRELAEQIPGEHQDDCRSGLRSIELKERDLQNVCETKEDPPGFWLRISRKIPFIRGSEKFWLAHRAAVCWFGRTIEDPKTEPREEGFNRSPVLTQLQRSSSRCR